MTRPWMGYLAGTAFVLSMAGAATAYAQSSVQNAQNEAASDSHADRVVRIERHGPGPDLGDGDHHRIERRIVIHHGQDPAEHLRTMLQLKPNQEAALQAYVAAIHPKHGPEGIVEMSGPGPSGHGEARTTTQKLADMESAWPTRAPRPRPASTPPASSTTSSSPRRRRCSTRCLCRAR